MISTTQFFQIAQDLEVYHGIFSRIWQMGKPIADPTINTAAIRFDSEGGFFSFCFNPDFFKALNDYNLKFIICHEALHVILNHGIRGHGLIPEIANIAMDVVINESLVSNFGFDRNKITDEKKYCWYDTIFKPEDHIKHDKSFEYYYDVLYNKCLNASAATGSDGKLKIPGVNGTETVDTHDGFGSEHQDQINDKLDDAADKLSNEERTNLKDKVEKLLDDESQAELNRGVGVGGMMKIMNVDKIKPKRKWETVIKRWAQQYMKRNDKNHEQWARVNRRFVTLSKDMFIPTEMEIDNFAEEKHRVKVVFFLDTSGSCRHLATRFWDAAKSLPVERFDIQLCCFDDDVYETSLESGKLYGFGGTSFDILEHYVQKYRHTKNNGKYPDAVFVITDGCGNPVKPEFCKKWYWFLSMNYRSCIPKECNIFDLKDYE